MPNLHHSISAHSLTVSKISLFLSVNSSMEFSSSSKAVVTDSGDRNWLDLPHDLLLTIFLKLGGVEILTNAHGVCSLWRAISKDPLLWRAIHMHNSGDLNAADCDLVALCRRAVDCSSGLLLEINIEHFATDDLLRYIADSTSNLRRLRLACCHSITDGGLCEVAKKLPQLEELDISISKLSKDPLEAIGRCCPHLKSLKFNKEGYRRPRIESDEEALVIAETMPELRHLQLFGNKLTNNGLLAILDGCPHLESIDLRRCINVKLDGGLGKRCVEQIKDFLLPNDPTDDLPFECEVDYGSLDEGYPSDIEFMSDDEYDFYELSGGIEFSDYDHDLYYFFL